MPVIPLAPGTQEAVSGAFATPKGSSFGDIFDTLLALKQQEQKRVSDAFEAITRGNPALAAFLAAQPGFVENLTAAPRLRGPSRAKAATGQIERGAQEFGKAKPATLDLTGAQQSQLAQDAIADLTDEAQQDEKKVAAYLEARLSPDSAVVQRNITALAKAGDLRRKATGSPLLETIDFILEHKTEFTGPSGEPLIRPGSEFADAFNVARQPGASEEVQKRRLLELQEMLLKDVLGPEDLIKLSSMIADEQEQIAQAEERKKKATEGQEFLKGILAKTGATPEDLAKSGVVLPEGDATTALLTAADDEIARRREVIRSLESLKARGTKAKPKPGERAAETPEERKRRLRALIPAEQ